MTRLARWLLPPALLALVWLSFSWPTYDPPPPANVRLRLNYLERVIREGGEPGTALGELTRQNPEWGLFTLAFTTYALANLAQQNPALRPEAARYIALAIQAVLAAPIRQPFADSWPTPSHPTGLDSLPPSVLYLGHLNLMLGCHRQLVPASPFGPLHDSLSAALYRRYDQEPAGNLASYPSLRWLPDNTVALASLALHGRLTGSPYAAAGRRWAARAPAQWLDAETGLLASQVDEGVGPAKARAAPCWAGASGFWRASTLPWPGSSTGATRPSAAPTWAGCASTASGLAAPPPAWATWTAARCCWATASRPPPSPAPMPWRWATAAMPSACAASSAWVAAKLWLTTSCAMACGLLIWM
ncbi:MAG: hypothetical protein WKG07_44220 [Hymenobacter sp.]